MREAFNHIRVWPRPLLAAALLVLAGFAPAHAAAPDAPELQPGITIGQSDTGETAVTGSAYLEEVEIETAEDHKSEGLPQLDFSTYTPQLFWMAVIFFLLYLVMAKKALPEIGGIVENRKTLIDTDLKTAEDFRAKVAEIQGDYERELDTARTQALRAVQDVESVAAAKAAEQLEAFRARSEKELVSAEDRVVAAKSAAMAQMTAVAADVASVAAEKITGQSTDRQNAQAIVESLAAKAEAA